MKKKSSLAHQNEEKKIIKNMNHKLSEKREHKSSLSLSKILQKHNITAHIHIKAPDDAHTQFT